MAQQTIKKAPQKKPKAQSRKAAASKPSDYKWIWIAGIVILTFIAFAPALKCDLTNWDDNVYVPENTLITSLTADHVKKIFSIDNPVSLNYHPLTILSLAIDYHFAKLAPYRYHLVNLLFHLMNTVLVFLFIHKLSRQKILVAAFVSIFFGIHPMHVESVAWVAERKDVLYTFFFMAGLITYMKYQETKKIMFMAFTFLLFILSVLSKAMAVVLPVVLLLIDYYTGRKITLKVIAEKIPFFIISLLAGWLAVHIQSRSAIAAYSLFSLVDRLSFGFYGFTTYIWKMFLPVNLSAFYPYPITDIYARIPPLFYATAACGFILFVAVAVLSFVKKEKMKLITFGAAFFFVTIIMVLQFLSVGQVIMADRYSYVPYIGLLFIIGMMLHELIQKKTFLKTPIIAGMTIIALLFSYLTNARTQVWKNSETLWTDVQQKYPFPPWTIEVAYENRGNYYAKEQYNIMQDHKLLDKGLDDYLVLMDMKTKNYNIFKNLGNIYGLKGQDYAKEGKQDSAKKYIDKAIAAYDTAIILYDKDADMFINLAITYGGVNRHDLAALNYSKALKLRPGDVELTERHALASFSAGDIKGALADFLVQAELQPGNSNPFFNIAICYERLGDKANALTYILKAKQMGHAVDEKFIEGLRK